MIEFRNSDIATYLECRRKWQFSYLQSLELARDPNTPTPNLSLGSIFHRAHEAFWTGGDAQDALSACEAEIAAALPEGTPLSAEWLDELRMARAMARHYEAWLETGEVMHERPVYVEHQMRWEVLPGVFLTGKLDRLAYDTVTEQYVLIDVKTTKSFMRAMTHARQLKTYACLLRREGIHVSRLVTEQVRKVLGTGTAKPPFVERVEMFCDDDVLDRHEIDMQAVLDEMLELKAEFVLGDTSRLYPNPTKDCGWKCPYLPLCTATDNGDNVEWLIDMQYRPKTEDHI